MLQLTCLIIQKIAKLKTLMFSRAAKCSKIGTLSAEISKYLSIPGSPEMETDSLTWWNLENQLRCFTVQKKQNSLSDSIFEALTLRARPHHHDVDASVVFRDEIFLAVFLTVFNCEIFTKKL